MLDDLLKTATTTHPNDFGFLGNVWTTPLSAEYINQNYGIKYPIEYIRLKLKATNFSFKRAQRKATKANKDSQKAFKKMNTILTTVKNSSDCILYAIDETLFKTELDNLRT